MSVIVKDYFQIKSKDLGITISEQRMNVFLLSNSLNGEMNVTPESAKELDKSFLGIILNLLITPDISEDDYSVKYDRKAIESWYAAECIRLGVQNGLNKGKNQVKDMSFLA